MSTVKKQELAEKLKEVLGTTKAKATLAVDTVFEEMANAIENEDVVDIHGFGKFSVIERGARQGINPATKEKIEIAPSKAVKFKPSKVLKDKVKNK